MTLQMPYEPLPASDLLGVMVGVFLADAASKAPKVHGLGERAHDASNLVAALQEGFGKLSEY